MFTRREIHRSILKLPYSEPEFKKESLVLKLPPDDIGNLGPLAEISWLYCLDTEKHITLIFSASTRVTNWSDLSWQNRSWQNQWFFDLLGLCFS